MTTNELDRFAGELFELDPTEAQIRAYGEMRTSGALDDTAPRRHGGRVIVGLATGDEAAITAAGVVEEVE